MNQAEKFKSALMGLIEGIGSFECPFPTSKKIEDGIVTLTFKDGSALDFTEPKIIKGETNEQA